MLQFHKSFIWVTTDKWTVVHFVMHYCEHQTLNNSLNCPFQSVPASILQTILGLFSFYEFPSVICSYYQITIFAKYIYIFKCYLFILPNYQICQKNNYIKQTIKLPLVWRRHVLNLVVISPPNLKLQCTQCRTLLPYHPL